MKRIVILVSKRRFYIDIAILLSLIVFAVSLIAVSTISFGDDLSDKVIVIDAGHGGVDSGANNSFIKEKDINLDIALRLQKSLESSGAKVIMTRTEDIALSKSTRFDRARYMEDLNARVDIINNSSAHIFISIHANSSTKNPSTRGMIAFYNNSHPHNRDMAYMFQNIFNTYSFDYDDRQYKSHHIPQKGKYYILLHSKIPGLIIETGFITNSTDLFLFKMPEYREYIADSIYHGILEYFLSRDKLPLTSGYTADIEEENAIDMYEEEIH